MLKHVLILARAADHVLMDYAVKAVVAEHLSASQVHVLRLLGLRGSHTSVQIARLLGVTRPAVSQLIDPMVRRKLAMRRTAKQARRTVGLPLTPKGQATFEAVRHQQRDLLRRAAKQAPAAEAKGWTAILEEMTAALAHTSDAVDPTFAEA